MWGGDGEEQQTKGKYVNSNCFGCIFIFYDLKINTGKNEKNYPMPPAAAARNGRLLQDSDSDDCVIVKDEMVKRKPYVGIYFDFIWSSFTTNLNFNSQTFLA